MHFRNFLIKIVYLSCFEFKLAKSNGGPFCFSVRETGEKKRFFLILLDFLDNVYDFSSDLPLEFIFL